MQYQVPHFLETEQRILGPFTFANFVIMIAVAGVLAILYFLKINFVLWIFLGVFFVGTTLALMFGSYNGRGLAVVFVDFVRHIFGERKHTWIGVETKETVSEFVLTKKELRSLPNVGEAKPKENTPVTKRTEEISKMLDQK